MVDTGRKHILITGNPGVGKTTLIRKIANELNDHNPVGFYTAEIRERGIRKGFELVGLEGVKAILAHTDIKSSKKVGKYGVDLIGFEGFLGRLEPVRSEPSIVIIDEIGKMECFSDKFMGMIGEVLESENLLVATVALKGGRIIADIKKRDDVNIFEVTRENRDRLAIEILSKVNGWLKRGTT
ncbi:MAG: NTPase [Thermodesulfovibrionales bacterium]